MIRYYIALTLDTDSDRLLRQSCQTILNHIISIKSLHLTLMPPFFLKADINQPDLETLLHTIPNQTHSATLSNLGVFPARNRKILYISLNPAEKFKSLHRQLTDQVGTLIQYDTNVYPNDKLPSFKPHITLSYNYKKTDGVLNLLQESIKDHPIKLEGPHLFRKKQTSDKTWQKVF